MARDVAVECQRHKGFPYGKPGPNPALPWYVVRCVHVGNRFVVELKHGQLGDSVVDYVEDTRDEDARVLEVTVETGEWENLHRKLLNGDPPNPENN